MTCTTHTAGPWLVRRAHGGSQYYHITSALCDNIAVFTRIEDAEYVSAIVNAAPALLTALDSASRLLMAAALVITHAESRSHAIVVAKDAQEVFKAITNTGRAAASMASSDATKE